MSKHCHHPQGGFCEHCRANGLASDAERAAKLVADSDQRIYEFAAYFVEGCDELQGLVSGLEQTLRLHVEADMRRRRRTKAGELDYVRE